jgi:hypothetical protein
MRTRFFVRLLVVCLFIAKCDGARAQSSGQAGQASSKSAASPSASQALSMSQVIERVYRRETEEEEIIASYTPVIETYIQIEKADLLMGTLPKRDLYYLGIADYRRGRIHVRSMTEKSRQESPLNSVFWSFEPAGFLQMSFLDWGAFDKEHYVLKSRGRTFLGEVRCYIFDVARAPKAKGPRFRGRIWVEDQDFTIVRMNGDYAPENLFSVKHFQDEFYVHF